MNLQERAAYFLEHGQPIDWPTDAPKYNSHEGWAFEKELARQRDIFQIKDNRASKMLERCSYMAEMAFRFKDKVMYNRYHRIFLRICEYRYNLSIRYPL